MKRKRERERGKRKDGERRREERVTTPKWKIAK